MNAATMNGMRMMAETMQEKGDRFALVELNADGSLVRVRAFDMPKAQAEDWNTFYPKAKIVSMDDCRSLVRNFTGAL